MPAKVIAMPQDGSSQRTEVFQAVSKGQNGQVDAILIPEGVASRLYNVTVRNGLAESRPALTRTVLPVQGRFQGAFVYELEGAVRWVVVVSGQVWVHNLETGTWVHADTFPTTDFDQAYFVQAERYCIVQNGVYEPENWPVIIHEDSAIDNLDVQYASGTSWIKVGDYPTASGGPSVIRVPIGKAMAFGHGRLFVAVDRFWSNGLLGGAPGWSTGNGLRYWLAGDVQKVDNAQSLLVFTETDYLNEGQAMGLPAENGFITSMGLFRNAATGSGLGALVIVSRRGVTAFAVNVKRSQWKATELGQNLFSTSGSRSPWSLIPVNSDLVYYGDGGLRTVKYTASNETAAGGLATFSMSPEVSNFTDTTLAEHEAYVTVAGAGNYVFFTAGGVTLDDGSVAFRAVLPWDLANFQASGSTPSRVFAGAWTGGLYHAVLRASRDTVGAVYRDTETGGLVYGIFDSRATSASQVSVVRTGAFMFTAPKHMKRMKYVDLMFDRVRTDLAVRVRWRVDGGGPWSTSDIRRFSTTAQATTGLFRIPVDSDGSSTGFFFEFSIEWRGAARMKLAYFQAVVLDAFSGGEDSMCETFALDSSAQYLDTPQDEYSATGDWP